MLRFDGGEWALFGCGVLGLAIAATLGILLFKVLRGKSGDLKVLVGIVIVVFGIVGAILVGTSFASGHSHGVTTKARHDLRDQGFSVVSVDLSGYPYSYAVVTGPGGCQITLRVLKADDGTYKVYNSLRVLTPETTTCDM